MPGAQQVIDDLDVRCHGAFEEVLQRGLNAVGPAFSMNATRITRCPLSPDRERWRLPKDGRLQNWLVMTMPLGTSPKFTDVLIVRS